MKILRPLLYLLRPLPSVFRPLSSVLCLLLLALALGHALSPNPLADPLYPHTDPSSGPAPAPPPLPPLVRNQKPRVAIPPGPRAFDASYGTNDFVGGYYFSSKWSNLLAGHTYDLEQSLDGHRWQRLSTILWSDPDPNDYWQPDQPALPAPPGVTTKCFYRLRDVTP